MASTDSGTSAGRDGLDRIFATDRSQLAATYDEWAASYDDDHDGWGWRGPESVVDAALGHAPHATTIFDAGCGTGRVGAALRALGWGGRLVGLDFSTGMLEVAEASGWYDELIRCSLYDLPFPADSTDVVVSAGVFTHGHVGGEALAELARITRPAGLVTITQRVDIEDELATHQQSLVQRGIWHELERTEPGVLHPDRDTSLQSVLTWRVR